MAGKKPTERELMLARVLERQKKSRFRCEGCYAPDDKIRMKTHLEKIFPIGTISLVYNDEAKIVSIRVPCHFCGTIRTMELNSNALLLLKTDILRGHRMFILVKGLDDDGGFTKFNELWGCDEVEQDTLVSMEEIQ